MKKRIKIDYIKVNRETEKVFDKYKVDYELSNPKTGHYILYNRPYKVMAYWSGTHKAFIIKNKEVVKCDSEECVKIYKNILKKVLTYNT